MASRASRVLVALIVVAVATGGLAAVVPVTGQAAAHKKHKRHKKHRRHHGQRRHKRPHHKRPPAAPTPTPTDLPAQSATGDLVAGDSFHLVFDARRAAGTPVSAATGMFKGAMLVGGMETGYFAGPVMCLDVRGSDIGLFYPIRETSPPGGEQTGGGVFITVRTDGAGHATSAGFMPVPTDTTEHCGPTDAPMAAQGSATATGG